MDIVTHAVMGAALAAAVASVRCRDEESALAQRRLQDIERFRVFSEGFIVHDAAGSGLVGDARYAMQPTAVAPIWGIAWRGTGAATDFVSRHDFSPEMRSRFFAMLLGRDTATN